MHRISYANVVATLALFVALGGGAYAAVKLPKASVGTKQLKKNAVTSAKVAPGTLLASDFRTGELPAGRDGAAGRNGTPGRDGERGPTGPAGADGTDATLDEALHRVEWDAPRSDDQPTVFPFGGVQLYGQCGEEGQRLSISTDGTGAAFDMQAAWTQRTAADEAAEAQMDAAYLNYSGTNLINDFPTLMREAVGTIVLGGAERTMTVTFAFRTDPDGCALDATFLSADA